MASSRPLFKMIASNDALGGALKSAPAADARTFLGGALNSASAASVAAGAAAANRVQEVITWAMDNPRSAAAIGAGAAVVTAPAVVAGPALAATGFGAQGVVACKFVLSSHSFFFLS